MVSELVQISVMSEQVCRVSPHNITMVLAAVNTLKGKMEETWYLQLSSEVTLLRDGVGQRTDTQIVAGWYDDDCPVL